MNTIYVMFVGGNSTKSYRFLNSNPNVKIGDEIIDMRYNYPMIVINISPSNAPIQKGIVVKEIVIDFLNKVKMEKGEKRTINVTIEQAREWYQSGIHMLKILALTAFSREELSLDYDIIASKVLKSTEHIDVPLDSRELFYVLAKLRVIAKYYNGDWKKTTNNTGYFLSSCNGAGYVERTEKGVDICRHDKAYYAGIVYFRNIEDAINAVKLLKDNEIQTLFL